MKKIDLSIIIVSFNTKEYTRKCIESVVKYTKGINYEIVVVDNNSNDGSVKMLRNLSAKNKHIKLICEEKNLGFAGGNNAGILKARGKYLLFLNSDTEFEKDILYEMINYFENRSELGVLSCKLVGHDGKVQGNGGYFPNLLRVFSWMVIQDFPIVDKVIKPFHPLRAKAALKNVEFFSKKQRLDWVTGALLLTRSEIFKEVGWDDKYFMYTEDVDICFQIKQRGWEVEYNPEWYIRHYGGASSNKEYPILSEFEGVKRFYKKFYPKWNYPVLRLILKIGAFGRVFVLGILEGKEAAKIYVKAFRQV